MTKLPRLASLASTPPFNVSSGISPKVMIYAAGLDAKAIICVGQDISPEIRQTFDWLNSVSRDDVNFYGMELELWRIDDSVPAPNFNVVCQPNMWARQLKMGQDEGENGTQHSTGSVDSKSKKEEFPKGVKEKVPAPQGKAGAGQTKDGVSVRQNFVYTKTFS